MPSQGCVDVVCLCWGGVFWQLRSVGLSTSPPFVPVFLQTLVVFFSRTWCMLRGMDGLFPGVDQIAIDTCSVDCVICCVLVLALTFT